MNIWRISCHGQSFPEANAADELSFNCIYSGRCPLGTVFLSAYVSSLVLVIVSLLLEYKMILDWVNKNDWSAMLDVVPTMFFVLCVYVVVMIVVNVFIIYKSKK